MRLNYRFAIAAIFLSSAVLYSAEARPPYVDDFSSREKESRIPTRGPWEFKDGMAYVKADPNLVINGSYYGPMLSWQQTFHDATIGFEMKYSDSQKVILTLNGDGHVFRVRLGDARPSVVFAWTERSSPTNSGENIAPDDIPQLADMADRWVKVRLIVKGSTATLSLGDWKTTFDHPALLREKKNFTFSSFPGEMWARDFSITYP